MKTNMREVMANVGEDFELCTRVSVETFGNKLKDSFPATRYTRIIIDGKEYEVEVSLTML